MVNEGCQGCPLGADVRGVIDGSCTPSGVRLVWNFNPGVVVAGAPRPPANVCNPCRDKELLLSPHPPTGESGL